MGSAVGRDVLARPVDASSRRLCPCEECRAASAAAGVLFTCRVVRFDVRNAIAASVVSMFSADASGCFVIPDFLAFVFRG